MHRPARNHSQTIDRLTDRSQRLERSTIPVQTDIENTQEWTLSEAFLRSSDGRQLRRLPAHRAFWFGWYSGHPDTALVQ